jgi:radical SAM protein with 4Fe4S-binding SPASM domain
MTPEQRYALWKEKGGLQFLRRVNFELSSVCNLRCAYCSLRHRPNYPRFMPEPLFRKIVSELSYTPVQVLGLYFSGESLLHPEFESLLKIVREILNTNPKFRPLVYMHTNGTLWTPERTNSILSYDVLQQIIWSIDGVDKTSFERMRPGATYSRVLDQCEYLLDHRPPNVVIHVNNMLDAECRDVPLDKRLQNLFHRVDRVKSYYPYDLSEGPSFGYYQTGKPQSFCCYNLDTIIVTAEGKLSLCCVDLNARNAFGNLYEESFVETYNSRKHRQYMDWMSQGERVRLPGCTRCTVSNGVESFAFGIPIEKQHTEKGTPHAAI